MRDRHLASDGPAEDERAGLPPRADDRAADGREAGDATSDARRHEVFAVHVLPEVDVLLRVALTFTRHRADAEDLVQDTLVRAFRACDRFDGAHPRAWLMTILRNTHLNRIRSRRPGLLHEPDGNDGDLVTWPGAPRPPTPEDVVVAPVFDDAVAQALGALPEVFRSAVSLVDLDGLTYAEAAEVLGVPVGTVMSRLHRGRARIREQLVRSGMVGGPPERLSRVSPPGDRAAPVGGTAPDMVGRRSMTNGWRRGGRT